MNDICYIAKTFNQRSTLTAWIRPLLALSAFRAHTKAKYFHATALLNSATRVIDHPKYRTSSIGHDVKSLGWSTNLYFGQVFGLEKVKNYCKQNFTQ